MPACDATAVAASLTPVTTTSRVPAVRLPPDIIDLVLGYCDRLTRHSVLLSCRDYYEVAIPHVYEHIVLSFPEQLRGLGWTVGMARTDRRLAHHFHHTRSFTYRIGTGNPSSAAAKDTKTYLALASLDCSLPQEDGSDASQDQQTHRHLFPNLTTATFEPLPVIDDFTLRLAQPHGTSILENVTTVHLAHSTFTVYDKAPCFQALGMTNVRELHIHHLVGAEVEEEADIDKYLGYQGSLLRVHFHLRKHFAYAIGYSADTSAGGASVQSIAESVSQVQQPPAAQWMVGYEQMTLADTTDTEWYILEYSAALAYTVLKLAYFRRTRGSIEPSCPRLQEIIIELGKEDEETTDEMLQHSKEKIYFYKRQYIDHSPGTGRGTTVPTVELRLQGGTRWLLDGQPAALEYWTSYDHAWKRIAAAPLQRG